MNSALMQVVPMTHTTVKNTWHVVVVMPLPATITRQSPQTGTISS